MSANTVVVWRLGLCVSEQWSSARAVCEILQLFIKSRGWPSDSIVIEPVLSTDQFYIRFCSLFNKYVAARSCSDFIEREGSEKKGSFFCVR